MLFHIIILKSLFVEMFSEKSNKLHNALPPFKASWESLDNRALPSWYDAAKFGIFIHWGVYSVPSFHSEWFWWWWKGENAKAEVVQFMENNYPSHFKYKDFAPMFTAELWNPSQWADLLAASGAKYVVLTAKHHDGYALWPSVHSNNWNSLDVGPKKDLVGELERAVRERTNLRFGIYYSLLEWFHPLYREDKSTNFNNNLFPKNKILPELVDLVNRYLPDVVWSDGEFDGASSQYWKSPEFLAWLYNESPVKDRVVTNDRWGNDTTCIHGGFLTCNDKYNPGILVRRKWENCDTIDKHSWGYRREATLGDYITIEEFISKLVTTVSCGGNLLMNVGPTKEGTIAGIYEERLLQIGKWLSINGEAIYFSVPWIFQQDPIAWNTWYTTASDDRSIVYALVLSWPLKHTLYLGAPLTSFHTTVTMLGMNETNILWSSAGIDEPGMTIYFPILYPPDILPWAWVLKLQHLRNAKANYGNSRRY